ncbi:MAG: proline--tRNA ligase [Syntrophobacterales bacterium]|nr:MAG: proline--tRNA ligase [Syntrophobacterales bacterium]
MRYSQLMLPTLKEDPAEAEVISHRLMFRAGMIRKVAAGIYSFLPLGLRVIQKVERIIREEMNRAGAQEVLLPCVQPAELWMESHRWQEYGKDLLRIEDRHSRDYCFGPTHEEVITDIARREIRSYRQMPLNFYQIQTKFRDEIRPRFGVMRCREFIMKDAYSFDTDEVGLGKSYQKMYEAYTRIFTRCGLTFEVVEAETGLIGGTASHEFMVLAETGEETIVSCQSCNYAANIQKAEAKRTRLRARSAKKIINPLKKVETPDKKTVEEVTKFLKVMPEDLVKTLIFETEQGVVATLIQGDHEINESKLGNLLGCDEVKLASDDLVLEVTGAPKGYAGPIGLSVKVIGDYAVESMVNFVTGANEQDAHYINVNLGRDVKVDQFADLRMVKEGDLCPRCGKSLNFSRGIEVGHIFKLGTKYSKALRATYLDENGREREIVMGCYGIGVARTAAAAIEQYHDEDGIIWPMPIAPFQVIVVPVNSKIEALMETAEEIYRLLVNNAVEVLLDDRDSSPGVKFKDADLIGVPLRVTIGEKNLKKGLVEIRRRKNGETTVIEKDRIVEAISALIHEEVKGSLHA